MNNLREGMGIPAYPGVCCSLTVRHAMYGRVGALRSLSPVSMPRRIYVWASKVNMLAFCLATRAILLACMLLWLGILLICEDSGVPHMGVHKQAGRIGCWLWCDCGGLVMHVQMLGWLAGVAKLYACGGKIPVLWVW